jgi:NADH:ubiquinone oxidoreductase subunit F (NADH-binding)
VLAWREDREQVWRLNFVESCGQCPACRFGTGEVTQTLSAIEASGGSDRDLELILKQVLVDLGVE